MEGSVRGDDEYRCDSEARCSQTLIASSADGLAGWLRWLRRLAGSTVEDQLNLGTRSVGGRWVSRSIQDLLRGL